MNQRHASRHDESINVWLYQDNHLIAKAKTKNMTNEGMYINTNGLLFPKNSSVDISFEAENDKPLKRRKAKVVHRNLKGIGVTFVN